MPQILEHSIGAPSDNSPSRARRVEMNREFKPKLKAFMRDYQSPYRYSSTTNANNRSVELMQNSVEQHFALAPEVVAEQAEETSSP